MFKVGRAVTSVFLVLALAAAVDAASARAGTYEVAVCHDPATGDTAPTDGISFPTSGAYLQTGVYEGCGASGYLYATLDGRAPHGPGDLAAWEFQAPANTTITGAELWRAAYAGPGAADQWPVVGYQTVSTSGAVTSFSACSQDWGCASTGTDPSTELAPDNVLSIEGLSGVTALEGTAVCAGGESCAPGGGAVCPELGGDPCIASNHLYALVATLEDDTAPTAEEVSGSLVEPGVLQGLVGVTFDATDTGSGLYRAAVIVDGTTVASEVIDANGGHCEPLDAASGGGVLRFGWAVPCALSASASLEFDTSALDDGSHSASVTVSDAAGNTATVWSGTIETDNAPRGGAPQVSGEAAQGSTLSAVSGSWYPDPTGYLYEWERCDASGANCSPIPGATSSIYTATAADAYHRLAVLVSAYDADGLASVLSPPSSLVADIDGYTAPPPPPALAPGSLPSLDGGDGEGDVLTAAPGVWLDGPLAYAYQWESCDSYGLGCTAIAGAVGSTYRITGADVSARLRVSVTVSGPGGSNTASSDASPLIAGSAGGAAAAPSGPVNASAPVTERVANGIGACRDPSLHATIDGKSRVDVRLGRPVTLHGALTCGAAAVRDATVRLAIAPTAGALRARALTLRTGAHGRFAYRLASGPSRRITASYDEYPGQATPSAHAQATLLVTPSISLSITPTSTVNGHTVTFTGAVTGGDEPPGGLPLELEYLEGGRWMTYTIVWAQRSDGRFSYRYTFTRTTESITYTFRFALAPGGISGYPYQPTASPPRSVHVDP